MSPVRPAQRWLGQLRTIREDPHATETTKMIRLVVHGGQPILVLFSVVVLLWLLRTKAPSTEQACVAALTKSKNCGAWVRDAATGGHHICLRHEMFSDRFAHFRNPQLTDSVGAVKELVDPHLGCAKPISVELYQKIGVIHHNEQGHRVKMTLTDNQAWCMQWCFDGIAGDLSRWLCEDEPYSVYKNHDEM